MKRLEMFGLFGFVFFAMSQPVLPQAIPVSLPDDAATGPETSVTIPIEVGDLTGREVIAYQAVIVFDESVLDATGASSSGTLSGAFGPPTVDISEDGKISIGGFGTSPLSGSGTFVNLTFDVVGQMGDTTGLIFESFMFNSGEPAAEPQNGKFEVSFVTGVQDAAELPEAFRLRQNYPNPFNPETSVVFEVPAAWNARITLQIFNIRGQLVRTLFVGIPAPGRNGVVWDGRDDAGLAVSSGVYVYRIASGGFVAARKMLLAK